MEVNFFFQEKKNFVIQAKVVQFFTYWNQKIFFRKIKKKNLEFFFLNLRVPGRVHEGSKKKIEKKILIFPKKKFWFQYVKN